MFINSHPRSIGQNLLRRLHLTANLATDPWGKGGFGATDTFVLTVFFKTLCDLVPTYFHSIPFYSNLRVYDFLSFILFLLSITTNHLSYIVLPVFPSIP